MEYATVWDADACIDDLITARLTDPPAAVRQPGAGLYLLIDPFLGDPVLPEALQEGLSADALDAERSKVWQRPTLALSLPEGLSMDKSLAPYLVALTGVDDPWMDSSVQWAIQETVQTWHDDLPSPVAHRVGGWLQSAAQAPAVAAHLSQWLRLRTHQPTTARYLRLADRRVLGLARHVLGEGTLAASLAPIQHWHWLDAHGAWTTMSAHLRPQAASQFPVFDAQQWALMAHGPNVHHQMARRIAQRLTRSDCPAPSSWPPVDAAQWQAAVLASQAMTPDRRPQP